MATVPAGIRNVPEALASARATLLASVFGVPARTAPGIGREPIRAVSADLVDVADAFIAASPARDSGVYRVPNAREQQALRQAWDGVRAGDLFGARATAREHGFDVIRLLDTGSDRPLVLLAETPGADGAFTRGWGMYAWNPAASRPTLHIQAPHPRDDLFTGVIAARVLQQSDAASLALAGASRHSVADRVSDIAHNPASIFQAVHGANARPGQVQLQLHGFQQGRHPAHYPRVVVSEGAPPTAFAPALAARLADRGVDADYYDGRRLMNLAGVKNAQRVASHDAGSLFLHVEASEALRLAPPRRERYANALSHGIRAITPSSG